MKSVKPPRWATWLLTRWGHPDTREEAGGDLLELYAHWVQTVGQGRANRRYAWNALKLLRPLAKRKVTEEYPTPFFLSPMMLGNYFKTSWRNLLRYRGYAAINLVGLTLGLGVALVLFWIVRFEYGFDRYHRNAGQLYRLINVDGHGDKGSHVPQGVIKALNEQVSGVDAAANVYAIEPGGVRVGQTIFNVKYLFFAPPQFLGMIDVAWVRGSARQSLSRPGQVVLDEPTARRFFGDANPVGKTIRVRNDLDLTVSGIIRKMPVNSEFQFQMLASRETLSRLEAGYANENHWGGGDSMHHGYVLLKPGVSPAAIEATLTALTRQHQQETDRKGYELLPLVDVHRDTQSDADPYNYVLPQWMLSTLVGIGLFLILIACINFINLATVQATQRSREIAVRKVLGSSRSQLVVQFLGETALLVSASIVLGSGLATQVIPYANQLLNTQVGQSMVWDGDTVLFLLTLGLLVTGLAGGYPALVLSGFQPVRVLRGRWSGPPKWGVSLRQSLIVTQFVVAQVLIICTLLGVKQIRYFHEKDLGFDKSAIVTVRMPDRGNAVLRERFRQQLAQHPEIKGVAFGLTTPSSDGNWWWRDVGHRNLPNGKATFRFQYVDTNYFHFFKIPVLAGRTWTRADTNTVAIINEKAARDLGFKSPEQAIGERIDIHYRDPFTIMGVVKDYHSQSLRSSIIPHVFLYADWNFQTASIRIDPAQSAKALAYVERYWKAIFPNYYFEPTFLEDELRAFYEDERKLSNFLLLFTVVGIFIGCLGLFGLVSFVVTQRTKEIGVRKVLGATVASIVALLSKDFLKLVLIAFGIAAPIGYSVMRRFLQGYEYKTDIDWWVFALAGLLAVGIALLTVSFQSVKAALTNPVKSLRSE